MSGEIERLATDRSQRTFALVEIDRLDDWALVEPPESAWSCFLADTGHGFESRAAEACAGKMLEQGVGFFCFWGPHASLLEDCFDGVIASSLASNATSTVPTIACPGSSLEPALEEFETLGWPTRGESNAGCLWLCVVVGDRELGQRVRRYFLDRV